MKGKLLISSMITLISLANVARADFILHSDNLDACANITGAWQGHGTASFLLQHCEYTGSGTIDPINQNGSFNLHINVNKDRESSIFCPANVSLLLPGTCINGSVVISTDYGNLQGIFSGDQGNATGQLEVYGTKADVNIQFHR